jgi:uncharacterized membrane protein
MNKVLFYGMVVFYLVAGVNHFANPDFYFPLIPDYLPAPEFINAVSGLIEIGFAIGLVFRSTRKLAALGIVLMLLAFIPAHVHFIQAGHCIGSLCVPAWVGWARLLIIHPALVLWAWRARTFNGAV